MKTIKNQLKYNGQHAYLALVIDNNHTQNICNVCAVGSLYDNKDEAILEANTLAKQIHKKYHKTLYSCVGYGQITKHGKLHSMKIIF